VSYFRRAHESGQASASAPCQIDDPETPYEKSKLRLSHISHSEREYYYGLRRSYGPQRVYPASSAESHCVDIYMGAPVCLRWTTGACN